MRIRVAIDPQNILGRQLTELETRQVPFATMQAINGTAFETRQRWAEVMPRVFDRPTPLTQKAVLYNKATKQRPYADIFLRDEAFKGTPPAKYLRTQVEGGSRRRKGIENRLAARGILPAGMFVVPGKFAPLDAYGNVPGSVLNQILSQIGARFDPLQNETDASRGRRKRRQRRQGQADTDYIALTSKGRRRAGIYQRVKFNFGGKIKHAIRPVLIFVSKAVYRPRFHIFDIARKVFARRYPEQFRQSLATAVASSWARTFK